MHFTVWLLCLYSFYSVQTNKQYQLLPLVETQTQLGNAVNTVFQNKLNSLEQIQGTNAQSSSRLTKSFLIKLF